MNRKIAFTLTALILVSIMIMTTAPFSYAVQWSPDRRLTTNEKVDWTPSLTSTTDEGIWVVWRSDRMDNGEIYYKIFNGFDWSNDTRLTEESHYDSSPSVTQTSDEKIWVVWVSDRNEQDQNLYYKIFNGFEWTEDTQLTNDTYADAYPSVMQASDEKIWVAWTSTRTGNAEIFYKIFNGFEWTEDTQLTNDTYAQDWDPSIMQAADGLIWFVFTKTTDTKSEYIYYKLFDPSESYWSHDIRLTFNNQQSDSNPSVMQASDGTIWVVWNSFRNGHDENIYYKVFDGSTWSEDTKLTTDLSEDMYPSIAQDTDQTIWVAWGSWRLGLPDIYYRINSHDVAITEVTVPVDIVFQGETKPINVTAMNRGTENETFQVKCHANSTLVGSETISLTPGQNQLLTFQWNTAGFHSGKYIISATAVAVPGEGKLYDNYLSVSSVEVRTLGDVCGGGHSGEKR